MYDVIAQFLPASRIAAGRPAAWPLDIFREIRSWRVFFCEIIAIIYQREQERGEGRGERGEGRGERGEGRGEKDRGERLIKIPSFMLPSQNSFSSNLVDERVNSFSWPPPSVLHKSRNACWPVSFGGMSTTFSSTSGRVRMKWYFVLCWRVKSTIYVYYHCINSLNIT